MDVYVTKVSDHHEFDAVAGVVLDGEVVEGGVVEAADVEVSKGFVGEVGAVVVEFTVVDGGVVHPHGVRKRDVPVHV